jgi:hypothetical protein
MKRFLYLLLFVSAGFCLPVKAQVDLRILNHLSVGAEVGTMGWGVDVSMPVTPFVDVQAGFSMIPKISFNTSLGMNKSGFDKVPVKCQTLMKNGKVMVNVMPIPILTSFHVTVGAYIGDGDIMGMYNPEPLDEIVKYNAIHPEQHIGLTLGDYLLEPDALGNIDGRLKVFPAKPYVGIGMGRGVPKGRIGFKFDLGCVFWGKPTIYCNNVEVLDTDLGGDGNEAMKIITKLKFYPVLNFRICGKIF